ncbi:phage tail protein [Paraburkholderia xenovorans]|uniref:phage tail protein n=1 Tax=Paraburkholderia xenovorans TaxID=36873 RepID=UPI0038BC889E
MPDIAHIYGGDLSASLSGDLLVANQSDTGVQRCYRRLLTNPPLVNGAGQVTASGDYTWQQGYGAGVARKVGSPTDLPGTLAIIKGQLLLERAVAPSPPPKITLTPGLNGVSVFIAYTDANTATPQFLEFNVSQEP